MKKEYRLNNMELNEMIENLKCCGNCANCVKTQSPGYCGAYCNQWTSDKETRADRKKNYFSFTSC